MDDFGMHLASALKKQQLLRDRVTGLVQNHQTGLLVYGRGGTGKSHVVEEQLRMHGVARQRVNSHITPLALFRELQRHRSEIVLLEDCETVLRNTVSLGILRSATFPSGRDRADNPVRIVDYHHANQVESFQFDGRIIMLMNRGLGSMPEAEALATRIQTLEFDLTDAEVQALMLELASKGFTIDGADVTPRECTGVVTFLVTQARNMGRRLNLRMLEHAIQDYLQADNHQSGCSWQDLVTSSVAQHPRILDTIDPAAARATELERELELVRSLSTLGRADRDAKWTEKTGKSAPTFYRRRQALAALDAQRFEA